MAIAVLSRLEAEFLAQSGHFLRKSSTSPFEIFLRTHRTVVVACGLCRWRRTRRCGGGAVATVGAGATGAEPVSNPLPSAVGRRAGSTARHLPASLLALLISSEPHPLFQNAHELLEPSRNSFNREAPLTM